MRVPFEITDGETGAKVGSISKTWAGLSKELFSDADNFEAIFPAEADPSSKARILGAVFLLNHLFFESSSSEKSIMTQ
jgi:hypothetical protein